MDSSDSSDEEAMLLIGIVVASEKDKRQQNMWIRDTHQVSFFALSTSDAFAHNRYIHFFVSGTPLAVAVE